MYTVHPFKDLGQQIDQQPSQTEHENTEQRTAVSSNLNLGKQESRGARAGAATLVQVPN